ncbi:HypC/HybG/HupF family hydrogenase formation chaperone [Pseudooceanicola sp. CBS1P-1]|uniref:HypC/HybG/HupF family hydrogenase formation chaperone n=1 Tax=Pseudooceanicola albus TaxID=2692189 RepID=A0A6L7G5S3_9RHOB|nr:MULTISPECIES: HypC/HybG/HupF family hydrogenase formation chaperone [Pseudooceanicola]MBT9384207.1 HypC/HybG/HupF family hydrogenase formation chaperone [Pseudooceanicola endophyticus]MXN19694.1 HypC/HybG/HupF family hydrogenase formation chaperone [Pseudooceanicola albus]
MCIGTPLRILSCDGIAGLATDGTREELIDLSLTGPLPAGTWVLGFLGTAREVISETEARQIAAALKGLRQVMAGGDSGDAFADLDARTPQLPPHLAAAHAAGKTHA